MDHLLRLLLVFEGLLVVVSTQRITFDAGSKTCKINGVSGACLALRDCPVNAAHVRARRLPQLRAALSACGSTRATEPMCCPNTSQPSPQPISARFRNHRLCGSSSFNPGRIVGGKRVRKLEDFPWMAALKWRPDGTKEEYRCGGAIINERWVLTAAHCITDGGPAFVRVRDLDLGRTTDDHSQSPPEDVPVERTFRHPDYKRTRRGLFADIGLLKLEKDLVFSGISKPLCLPERKRTTADYERLRKSYIAGWGLTEFSGVMSPHMMWAGVNITNHRACQEAYRRIDVADDEHICANGNDLEQPGCDPGANDGSCLGGVDACEGDSGGPLMLPVEGDNRKRWESIGIISFGSGCGSPLRPGIYARVDHFLDWIAETVNGN